MAYTVIGTPASADLAKKIAKILGAKYIQSKIQVFYDGESKITLPQNPRGKTVIVSSIHPPPDTSLIQTLSLIFEAKRHASEVIAIIPYLAYMRQDIEFLPGEIITSSVVAKLLSVSGASRIITADIHSEIALDYFDVPLSNVSAVPKLAKHFKKLRLARPLVVSPDLFWEKHAKEFANILSTESIALNKQRDRKTGKLHIIPSEKMNLSNRDIILVDDMISTGNSMIKAAQYLKKQNCGKIFACCTHGILVNDAYKRIRQAGIQKLVCTNTISGKNSVIDISDVLASAV